MLHPEPQLSVVLFYRYCAVGADGVTALHAWQSAFCAKLGLLGRVLVSAQGVNGTLSGSAAAIAEFERAMEAYTLPDAAADAAPLFAGIDWKESLCGLDDAPFPDLNVKQVAELVSSGGAMPGIDMARHGGTHLSPAQFHAMLVDGVSGATGEADEASERGDSGDVVLLDVRNRWEVALGRFEDGAGHAARHPNMRNFPQFAEYVQRTRHELAGKRVLMYCTGGIRCESASAYLAAAVPEAAGVFQLSGGIHRYCEEFGADADTCLFKGKNFVFDRRVAVAPAEAAACAQPAETGPAAATPTAGAGGAADTAAAAVVVGQCSECGAPHDEFVGGAVCTVCVCLVLVCERCRKRGVPLALAQRGVETAGAAEAAMTADATEPPTAARQLQQLRRREWFCEEHEQLRGAFFTFLDAFPVLELRRQLAILQALQAALGDADGASDPRQRRRTLQKQVHRVKMRIAAVEGGAVLAAPSVVRCRSCKKDGCKGDCWGFWKERKAAAVAGAEAEPARARVTGSA